MPSARRGRPPIIKHASGWRAWGDRFRAHMEREGLTQTRIAELLGPVLNKENDGAPLAQGTIGHWLTGRNEIRLSDFFSLCAVAKADPMMILFEKDIAQAAVDYVNAAAKRVIGPENRPPSFSRGRITDKAKERV